MTQIRIQVIAALAAIATPILASAQEPNYYEELQAAVVVDETSPSRKLNGVGMPIAGAVGSISTESIGKEIGSIVRLSKPFSVRSISFTVLRNSLEDCKAKVNIYRLDDDRQENILSLSLSEQIPLTDEKIGITLYPEESIELQPGSYFLSFSVVESSSQDEDASIHFPLYLKKSYLREGPEAELENVSFNMGLTVAGERKK